MSQADGLCYKCKWYEKLPDVADRGRCRRYPPLTFPQNTPQGPGTMTVWSTVTPKDSCGEWKAGILYARDLPVDLPVLPKKPTI